MSGRTPKEGSSSTIPPQIKDAWHGNLNMSEKFLPILNGAVRPYEETAATEKPPTRVVHITKADFLKKVYDFEKNPDEWKYLGSQPAIVDFYADWCGPCRQLSPVLDELAKEYSGKLTIYKVNVDNERGLATFFGIRSIPTLLFIPMKGKPQRSLGALSKTELKGIIKDVLKVEL